MVKYKRNDGKYAYGYIVEEDENTVLINILPELSNSPCARVPKDLVESVSGTIEIREVGK